MITRECSGSFDGGVEGTHQAVLDDAGDGEGAVGLAGEMGFDWSSSRVGRELQRSQLRLGGDLFVFRFSRCTSLIGFGDGHELNLNRL